MITVTHPNGTRVSFPDGTDKETIAHAMRKLDGGSAAPKSSEDAPSRLESFGRGALQSATFNLSDEAYGLAKGAYDKVLGSGDFSGTYAKERDAVRAANAEAAEVNPGSYLTGQVAGGVAVPMGAARVATAAPQLAAKVAPTLSKAGFGATRAPGAGIAAGAREGAAYGATMGFGAAEGGIEDQIVGTLGGAAMGGGAGAAIPAIMRGGRYVIQPLVDEVNSVIRPTQEAARRVAQGVELDNEGALAVQRTLGPRSPREAAMQAEAQNMIQSGRAGGDLRLVDTAGENIRGLARSAANNSPIARELLSEEADRRFVTQTDRITNFIRGRIQGPGNATQTREALEQQARNVLRPGYRKAYAEGDQPLWSDNIARLTGSPIFRQAMEKASERGKDRAISDGFGAFNTRVAFDPSGMVKFTKGPEGVPTYPNLQYWDYVKRELDNVASVAGRGGDKDTASIARQFARDLRNDLDTMVPSYQSTRSTAAQFFNADNALEAGEIFARGGRQLSANEAQRVVGRMSPPERALFQEGYLSGLMQKLENVNDRNTMLRKLASSPDERRRIEMAFGPDRAREIEAFMHIEGMMERLRGALGNSTTARQLMEMGLAGGAGSYMSSGSLTDPTGWIVGAMAGRTLRGAKASLDQRMARNIAEFLLDPDPQAYQRALNVATNNPRILNMLRNASMSLSGGQAATTGVVAANVAAPTQELQ